MTRDERNERISLLIEPMPVFSGKHSGLAELSDGGAWLRLMVDAELYEPRYESNVDAPFTRDWDLDESANAMLLDMMPEPELWVDHLDGTEWSCLPTRDEYGAGLIGHGTRKESICEAALKWLEANAAH